MYTLGNMPDLIHRLFGQDIGFLNIVAELWSVELQAPNAKAALPLLHANLLQKSLFSEIISALPKESQNALTTLKRINGAMPWAIFTRQFGSLREMGAGKRDRLKPHRNPVSSCEALWYRALIGRDFLDISGEIQDCAYIPNEFLKWLPQPPHEPMPLLGNLALPEDTNNITISTDHILDLSCTLLAISRLIQADPISNLRDWVPSKQELMTFLKGLNIIDKDGLPNPDLARPLLESPRGDALLTLAQGWLGSTKFNDLSSVSSLVFEGQWHYDPVTTRKIVLDQIAQIPSDTWWSIDAFVKSIFTYLPDFLRPTGNYDNWKIHSSLTGEPLQGFTCWHDVEGALIRHLITGPLYWLGYLDLSSRRHSEEPASFRKSAWFTALYSGSTPDKMTQEKDPVEVTSAGILLMTNSTPRIARYLISRFCLWESISEQNYQYRLTPSSLFDARQQGLTISHLIRLLRRYSKSSPAPSLIKALKQWDQAGTETEFEQLCVLRVKRQEIMEELRLTPAARFLGEPLGPLSVIVPLKAVDKVMAALARLGYLSDITLRGEK
ncbi:MAG: helicase-associated domain-containing protein [Anaerolineaceae bacterium]|nr:helicase-associated domain-containing protein [Anaerolineaceae bacterium]